MCVKQNLTVVSGNVGTPGFWRFTCRGGTGAGTTEGIASKTRQDSGPILARSFPETKPVCWGVPGFHGGSAATLQLDLVSQTHAEADRQGYSTRAAATRALSSTIPSWEVASTPDRHCGIIHLAQAATCRPPARCLLLAYGDKKQRLRGGCWTEIKWSVMDISPQDVSIDLGRRFF